MKKITFMLMLVGTMGLAQIYGNKQIETREYKIPATEIISIQFYAKVTIDTKAQEGMSITTDSNLFNAINKESVNGTLVLDQKDWIQPSTAVIIKIGAPNLRKLITGTHDHTRLINLNSDRIEIDAPIGDLEIRGQTEQLILNVKLAKVDASELKADTAEINISGSGKVEADVRYSVSGELKERAQLKFINEPDSVSLEIQNFLDAGKNREVVDTRYIEFRIKNNSWNRNHFEVVGPNPDGSSFSYGFPMMPGATRKERWSIGTRVYKKNSIGLKSLLVTIGDGDEGKTIKLFD